MKLNSIIILMTILIILAIGAVEAFLIFGGDNVISFDTNASGNDTVNDTNITNQTTTPINNNGNNNSSSTNSTNSGPAPEPNEEPAPPDESNNQNDNET